MESLEMEILSTLPRPRARRRQYFNSDQLMSILMVALASSVETVWRGLMSGDVHCLLGARYLDIDRPPPLLRRALLSRKGPRPHPVKGLWTMGPRESRSPNCRSQRRLKSILERLKLPRGRPLLQERVVRSKQTLGESLGPQASVMANAATAEKILAEVILPADKEKVDRLTFDQVVTKFLHVLGQGIILGSSLAVRSRDFAECALNQKGALAEEKAKGKKLAEDADAKDKVIARLEARISELERSQSLTQGRIIAAFKESDDFLEAVRGSASSYFGDGFDFCKRQLAHQYPDLGVDLEDVEMDHEILAKEEAEAEKRAAEEGAAGIEGVGEAVV
ncbi:hypothetical protein Acr_29g0008690 [Actinidia rufa]|uniref:Uncharacterized protein n=1 Tax=Actinidia rufa TaxID=165716 RepID=A0A7J0HF08_9ERIC|nr:hypothetical protein Acr_29g0008690 [Actinidia rufa]